MNNSRPSSLDLRAMARQVMLAQGFEPDFPPVTRQQLADISAHPPQLAVSDKVRDLRDLHWSSIDNDTSRDLDQIEVAERCVCRQRFSDRSARGQGDDHRLYRHN